MSQHRSSARKCGLPADAGNVDTFENLIVDFLKIIGDESLNVNGIYYFI